MNLSREVFFELERRLKNAGLDSDAETFDVIKERLSSPMPVDADGFAAHAIYVILAGGFSQKTAKNKHSEIVKYIKKAGNLANTDDLLKIFNNKNKMAAILKIWQNRYTYRDEYYKLSDWDSKLSYLAALPHIGKITANHLARNLGENVVKYDIWIQRLGCAFAGRDELKSKIDNGKLGPDVKSACDEMFSHLERETGLPRGYVDVVLFRACQNGLIKL
ncbi:MAG: hypothetical protein FWE17_00205 [Alphaproteobacteria bacterium]|nr:hypothetical protein [Alphaproteobacteria bacterium]MCL2757727.1 hypothetical protein [Alphaproteobacteria bacterium]